MSPTPTNGTAPHDCFRHPAPPPPPVPATTSLPTLRLGDPTFLAQALRTAQENLVALQKISEQTAQLHRQFLDGQDKTQRAFQSLLEQQQRLILLGVSPSTVSHQPAERIPKGSEARSGSSPGVPAVPGPERELGESDPRPAYDGARSPMRPHPDPLPLVEDRDEGMPADELQTITPSPNPYSLSSMTGEIPGERASSENFDVHPGLALEAQDPVQMPPQPSAIHPWSSALDAIQTVLLEVVAEKTGYPAEMLEPGMQLDADLGIDSIKRVEILSALQERLPEAPAIQPEHLGTLRTLGQIAAYLGQVPAVEAIVPGAAESPPPALSPGHVQEVLLEVVAEKTGYPAEMLEPGMQLDADLGIDSIKRVEILSALQERLPEAPAIQPEHLGTLRTLGQIAEFLAPPPDSSPLETPRVAGVGRHDALQPPSPSAHRTFPIQRLVVSRVALDEGGRREPVAIRAGGEVWIADDGSDLPPALASRLKALGHRSRVVRRSELAALGSPARLDGLIVPAPASGDADVAIKDAFRLVRAAAPGLRRAGRDGGAVFVTLSRLDGAFGLRGLAAPVDPTCGGLAGLAKTAGHEWPEVACKAIDLDPTFGTADQAAAAILDEMFRRGPAEVGLRARAGPRSRRCRAGSTPRDRRRWDRATWS